MTTNFLEQCAYGDGYRQALSDVDSWFERHSNSLKRHRLYGCRGVQKILNSMASNGEKFQRHGDRTSILMDAIGRITVTDMEEK